MRALNSLLTLASLSYFPLFPLHIPLSSVSANNVEDTGLHNNNNYSNPGELFNEINLILGSIQTVFIFLEQELVSSLQSSQFSMISSCIQVKTS